MTEHKEQEKEAVKNTKAFKSNSLNEFNIQNLTDDQKRLAFRELLKYFLSELHSGTILNSTYWLAYYESIVSHQVQYLKKEYESLKHRKDKKIISDKIFDSEMLKAYRTVDSLEFTTQLVSAIVHSTCPIA